MKFYLTEADKSRFIEPVWDELEYDPSTAMSYIDQSGDKFPSREAIIKWANSGAADKYKIDWQKFDPKKRSWKVEDVAKDIIQPYLDYLQSKEIKKDPKTSFSNKEDFLILHENEKYLFVGVLTYKGAIYCDSFKCGGAGARWCIGYEKTDKYWIDYCINQEKRFVLVYNKKVFGDEFNQKYMLEVRNSDFYDQRVTCTGWKQDDNPDDTLSTKECIENFEFTQEQLTSWFENIKDKIKIDSVDTFSMRAVMNGSEVQLSDKNQSVYLKDFDCDEFNYGTLLRNVKIGDGVRDLISKGEGKDLILTKIKMGPADKKEHDAFTKAVSKPKIILWGYNSVFIPDVWLSSSSPELLFMNCKTVAIGTLHLPLGFDPEDETCSDIKALIKDFNRNYTAGGLHFENSNSTITLGVKFFPRSQYCIQYPTWLSRGDNPSAFITKWEVNNAINGKTDVELLAGYKRAYIDFDGNKKCFENNIFDISKVVSGVPDNNGRIYCINVPVGCNVVYKSQPEADVETRYCNFNASNLTMTEENKTLKTKEFGDWAVVFWKKGSETLHIAQNKGDPGTTDYWMVGTTTRQFDYESGWLPNKEWTSTIKGRFSKDKAIQLAKERAEKSLKESKYVDKDIEPLGKRLSHHSDDGFIDFCTAKVLDDLNKGDKKKLDFYEFWDWAADVGSKDIVELISNDFKSGKLDKDSAVYRFYKTYENIKDLSLKDPKKFVKQYGWAYEDKIKDKSLKEAKEKALNESTRLLTESEDVMKLYRGIVKGRQRQLKTEGTGIWFSSSKDVAKTYSEEVETWELDTSLPLKAAQIYCHQKSWNEVNTDAYAREYKDYDIIIFKDIVDVGPLILNYTKQGDKRTPKEAFKDFTADTIVVNNPSCLRKVQTEILKESTETLKHFDKLYHGSHYGELKGDEKHKYNCLYVTPVFAYAALYSTDSDSEHGCVFEMQPVRDLNIFDANDENALNELKAKVEELNPENTLVRRIKWEDLKTKDWSTVCFKKDEVRDELLLKAVKDLGYDGYINHEWDEDCAQFYAEGLAGCGKVTNSISIGIFDENLLEITDEKYFDDYSDDDLFNECHQADEDFFINFLQDGGYNNFYYADVEEAANFAAENLPFLDVDEVNDLIEDYAN